MPSNGGGGSGARLERVISEAKYALYALVIYGDGDQDVIEYLRVSHNTLTRVSGPDVFVYWFEEWGGHPPVILDRNGKNLLAANITRPDALKLAQQLKIPPSKIPCVVFCRSLQDSDLVVYSLGRSSAAGHLGEHFQAILEAAANVASSALDQQIRKRLLLGEKPPLAILPELEKRLR